MNPRCRPGTGVSTSREVPPPVSADDLNRLTSTVIAAAIGIHRALGPGLLESAYLACLVHDLTSASLHIDRERSVPLVYRGVSVACAYRADLVVENLVLVEVKAVDMLGPIHSQQVRTYLRLADLPVGLLLNFSAPTMKEGIKRIVNGFPQ